MEEEVFIDSYRQINSGGLSNVALPALEILLASQCIAPENKVYYIAPENRVHCIAPENKVHCIAPENRVHWCKG